MNSLLKGMCLTLAVHRDLFDVIIVASARWRAGSSRPGGFHPPAPHGTGLDSLPSSGNFRAARKYRSRCYTTLCQIPHECHKWIRINGEVPIVIDQHCTYMTLLPAIMRQEHRKMELKQEDCIIMPDKGQPDAEIISHFVSHFAGLDVNFTVSR